MSAIKIHLDPEEYAPVARLAAELHLRPEDIAYAALDQLMLTAAETAVQQEIVATAASRRESLPRWSVRPRSIHAYEGMRDIEPDET